ncbi:hypothetical protein G6F57_019607 [Rhizopus arrhizus]|nr:hypothetical protein G6F57_019607 [Rhizopus arrhizus]
MIPPLGAPPAGGRKAAALLGDPAGLADALARHRRHWSDADPRAVASAWAMSYLWTLLPPVAAAASGARHALPARHDAMWIELDGNAAPAGFHIPELGAPDPDGDVWRRYEALVWHHLLPLADALFHASRLPHARDGGKRRRTPGQARFAGAPLVGPGRR